MANDEVAQLTLKCYQTSQPTLSIKEIFLIAQNVTAASDPTLNCYQKPSITDG